MADAVPVARSPLAHLPEAAREMRDDLAVSLRERPLLGLLNLRLDAASEAAQRVKAALGFGLPGEPNRATGEGGRSALWLGPDEYLVVTEPGGEAALARSLAEALQDRGAVTDVSDGRTAIEIAGSRARDVLATGCSLDLHPRVFRAGQCAQSGLAKARIILHQIDDRPGYRVFVERSHAEYLWLWLMDAAAEYRAAT
ncbi:MAG TPA: sarcosine oxidase subunit gamma family protein [Stellaceae bacterium]|nr:sarcosine oxidase subunit gamma family protein [Stellaceae bacterium]